MKEESDMIEKNQTWELVEKPQDRKIIGEEIYVEQPEGFSVPGHEEKLGFEKSLSESTLYVKKASSNIVIISLYVDDLLKYLKEILKRFRMDECKSVDTPMNQKEKLQKEDGAERVDEGVYRSLIGCLMYLTSTRPDILYPMSLHGYSDSDWAGFIDDMKSTSGYCFTFGSGSLYKKYFYLFLSSKLPKQACSEPNMHIFVIVQVFIYFLVSAC
ncbi:hypothetical protein K2173_002929 [Erythroxylum novogranatense]|uniref:Uncharacterized protein n=1 Tax=Erythroxylum novogranatense TaxID=1862640 RepID=A0AAV8TU53_9ROSI|nr:hypothetical protein K2173_002929 [Erythroxylum novogranatense]